MFTIVTAPQPAPPFHSLIRAADTTRDGDGDWARGLTYAPETPGAWRLLAACSGAEVDHTGGGPTPVVEYEPWLLQVEHPCHTLAGYREAEVDAELRRALDSTESHAIARELWTGEGSTAVVAERGAGTANPSLSQGATVLNGGTAVSPRRALGLIEQAAGDLLRGGRAVIHTSREAAPYVPDVTAAGNLLTTRLGNLVVADSGYPNTAPDGQAAAAGVGWWYVTGLVVVRRGTIRVDGPDAEIVDARTNTITRRVDRPVAATFDPAAHLAVAVTLA